MNVSAASGQVKVAVDRITERVGRQIISRGTRAVNAIRNAELETLNKPGSGRVYKKPGGGTYRASAPGEVPARRTGALRQQWTGNVEVNGSGSGFVSITARLVSNVGKYAEYMEYGTPGGKIAPRPYVEKIKEKALPKVKAIYSEPYV